MTTEISELAESQTGTAEDQPEISATIPASQLAKKHREWLILAALAIAMIVQLWTSVTQLSITSDEADHLHAAYRYWQCNDFGWNPEHPPLVKIVAGLPLQATHVNDQIANACGGANNKDYDFQIGHAFVFTNPEKVLTASRFAVSLFAVLLLVATWFFARKMFGLPVAVICGVLIAFEPNVLAHGALITTDVAGTLGFLLAVYAAYCYVTDPNLSRILALGLAMGFALCAKHSSVLLAAIIPAVLAADAILLRTGERGRRLALHAGALLIVAATAFIVLWASYGFRYAARPGGAAIWSPPRLEFAHSTVATKVIPQFEHWHLLAEAYLVGLQDILVESELGRPAFVLGKLYQDGNWFYFPVAAAIKFTLPFWLMLFGSAAALSFWRSKRRELLFLIVPAAFFLAFSMRSGLNIGIRHLLPILPFLIILAAAGAWSLAGKSKWAMAVLLALLVFHVTSSLHAYPNYLCYSNELWGGPANTYRYLANSDVDWGQAQKMARAYIDKMHPANCFFLRTYAGKNSDYGIPCQGISELQWEIPDNPYTGTMIVSSSMVDGVGVRAVSSETRRVFKDLKPVAKLGGSALLVYQGTFDLSPIVAAQLVHDAREKGEADPRVALDNAKRAVALDPSNGEAHVMICASYRGFGQLQEAEQECNIGLSLMRQNPKYRPEQIRRLEDFITRNELRIYTRTSTSQTH